MRHHSMLTRPSQLPSTSSTPPVRIAVNPACDARGLARVRLSPFQCPEVSFKDGMAVFKFASTKLPSAEGTGDVWAMPGLELVPDMTRLNLGGSFSVTFTIKVNVPGIVLTTIPTAQTDVESLTGQNAFDEGTGGRQRDDIAARMFLVEIKDGNILLRMRGNAHCRVPIGIGIWSHVAIRYSAEQNKCGMTVVNLDDTPPSVKVSYQLSVTRAPGGQDSLFLGGSLGANNDRAENAFHGAIADIMLYDEFITDDAAGYISGRAHRPKTERTNYAVTASNVALRPDLGDCTAPQENGFAYWRQPRECTDVETYERGGSGATCYKYFAGYVCTLSRRLTSFWSELAWLPPPASQRRGCYLCWCACTATYAGVRAASL